MWRTKWNVLPMVLVVMAGMLSGCGTTSPTAATTTVLSADVLITNGRIVDGTGNGWFRGDVAIQGGRIVAVGTLSGVRAASTIDARNHIVAPGFIDVHAHIETNVFDRLTADNYIHNGVTTAITGNCGSSADSLAAFFAQLERTPASINIASLVGHNTVRRQTMGLANRVATAEEQRTMESMVEAEMRAGAVGLSTGLIYLPGVYSTTEEVIALARAASKHRGIYASHIRNEGSKVADAINEALDVGRAAKMPVQISHFKVSAPANWGRSTETLGMIERAREEGVDVTIDQYPYTASSTSLSVMLPDWAVEGGQTEIRKRLGDSALRAKIVAEMVKSAITNKRDGLGYAVVARHAADATLNGKSIAAINRERGRPPTLEAEVGTALELLEAGGAQMVFHGMSEDDVRYFMRYPFNMVGTDGGVQTGQGMPHPRSYGTHARVLGKYVREEKIMKLEDAIRRMTSLAAQRFQLRDRGLLKPGYAADIVIFDDQTIADRATFDNPHQFSVGMQYVLVNGERVLDQGKHSGARAGVALRGPAYVVEAGRAMSVTAPTSAK
jgi:N-acyl-D-amino-acid deacylase